MPTAYKPADATIRLSQCMIVKNEEKNIEHALSWAKGIVFEQIVVDTGSTDRTVEIAERMGAKVFHFKWIDDFSAAKNYALDQASGDWIAFLDADEYVNAEHARLIIPLIENIVNLHGGKAVALTSKWAHVNDEGDIIQIDRQERIFINHPGVRYERPIHETLKIPDGTFPVIENDILIIHTGYAHSAYAHTGKLERNIALLKKALEADPEDIKSRYYLANDLDISGNIEEAIPLYHEVLNKTAREKSAYKWFRINAFYRLTAHLVNNTESFGEACTLAGQAFNEFPDHVNFCCLYGVALYNRGQFTNALGAFKNAEKLIADGSTEGQLIRNIDTLYIYLARVNTKLDNPAEALRYAVSYLHSHKRHEDMLKLCMRILRSKESPENAINFLSKIYDFKNIHDKMLLLRCAKDIGDIASAKLLIQMITPEELR